MMGTYTAFHFNAKVKVEVAPILQYMTRDTITPPTCLPDHELFKADGWRGMLFITSAYHPGRIGSRCRIDELCPSWAELSVNTSFKNYNGEIALFLDWIAQYLDVTNGEFLGYHHHEDAGHPTLLYFYDEYGIVENQIVELMTKVERGH